MLSTEDQTADLRRQLEQWIEVVGDRPLVPIQTSRVKLWLRKLDEIEDRARAFSCQPFA